MKLIEADKVKRVMKDYWKAQVDKALTLTFTDGNEANKRINSYLEHNHELLKAIDELPSAQPNTTTHDSIPAETGKNDGDRTSGDLISRTQSIDALRKMQTYKLFAGDDMILVDKAQVQTELMMLPPAEPEQRWIPVSEALPEEETDVLVTRTFLGCKDGSHGWNNHIPPSTYVEVAQYFNGEWTALSDEYKIARNRHTNPVAWMPLPEPYQEGEQK